MAFQAEEGAPGDDDDRDAEDGEEDYFQHGVSDYRQDLAKSKLQQILRYTFQPYLLTGGCLEGQNNFNRKGRRVAQRNFLCVSLRTLR